MRLRSEVVWDDTWEWFSRTGETRAPSWRNESEASSGPARDWFLRYLGG